MSRWDGVRHVWPNNLQEEFAEITKAIDGRSVCAFVVCIDPT